jgi:hypothetical protein
VGSRDDDWNAPVEDAPWGAPLQGLESAPAGPDTDDWDLPPVDGLEASGAPVEQDAGDWNLPPLEGLEQATAGDAHSTPRVEPIPRDESPTPIAGGAEPRRPSIADTDDDWNLPDGEPAIMPTPIESPSPSSLDVSLLPVENGAADERAEMVAPEMSDADGAGDTAARTEAAAAPAPNTTRGERSAAAAHGPSPAAPGAPHDKDPDEPAAGTPRAEEAGASTPEPPKRRKWQNPALEGLPLLDDDEDEAPAREQPPIAASKEPGGTPARPAARKKAKKATAEEMERIIALAEANQPELLPPD